MKTRFTSALVAIMAAVLVTPAHGDGLIFEAKLSGAQEPVTDSDGNLIPGGTDTDGTGRIRVYFDEALSKAYVYLWFSNLTGSFTAAHFHCERAGQSAPPPFGLVAPGPLMSDGNTVQGVITSFDFTGVDCEPFVGRPVNNIAALAFAMRDGLIGINLHTDAFPQGEIRGQMLEYRSRRGSK